MKRLEVSDHQAIIDGLASSNAQPVVGSPGFIRIDRELTAAELARLRARWRAMRPNASPVVIR